MGKIIVKIDKIGRPTVIGVDFVGTDCDAKMKPIEDAFKGGKTLRRDHPEYLMVDEETTEKLENTL